jgi:hypothetical protein
MVGEEDFINHNRGIRKYIQGGIMGIIVALIEGKNMGSILGWSKRVAKNKAVLSGITINSVAK